MNSTLIIKDLSLDKALDRRSMSAIRGGFFDQANATQQQNFQSMFAPVAVANGANFAGSGPVIIQVDSLPTQTASNDSDSKNRQNFFAQFFGQLS